MLRYVLSGFEGNSAAPFPPLLFSDLHDHIKKKKKNLTPLSPISSCNDTTSCHISQRLLSVKH